MTLRIGTRSWRRVAAALVRRHHYVALGRSVRVARRPWSLVRRYAVGGGAYPWTCELRTPTGPAALRLHGPHDPVTVWEIFCREDYAFGGDAHVVVDVGSNIGISAVYFLTRGPAVRVHLWEPDPRNTRRLVENLAPYAGRWRLDEAAVGEASGRQPFAREPSGRYGRLGASSDDVIEVNTHTLDEVLLAVLQREGRIDVLKLDTEGAEQRTLAAADPELLARVGTLLYESLEPSPFRLPGYEHARRGSTERLRRRRAR